MPSTVPAAIDAVVALCRGAVTGADVYDGPPSGGDHLDWIGVGYDPTGGESASATTEWAALGAQRHEENFDITCTAGSSSGDDAVPARRVRCYALLDAVAAALAVDYSLGGSVRVAHITSHSLFQERDEQGLTVGVRFVINCQARINGS